MSEADELAGSESNMESSSTPLPKAPPIESRFLFVDVAAMRAKQLRRGARVRLSENDGVDIQRLLPHKAERIAMEEVKRGLVLYEVPSTDKPSEPA